MKHIFLSAELVKDPSAVDHYDEHRFQPTLKIE